MRKDIDILIFLEHLNRELDTALLLKILLSQRGYSVRLASVFYDLWESVATLRPRLLIVPWAYSEVRKYCRFEPQPGEGLRILNLHHEQIDVESNRESRMVPQGEARKVFHLAWGAHFERILRSNGIPGDLIFRTGNPRLDLLRPEMSSFNPSRETLASLYGLDPEKRWVLIAGNFAAVTASERFIQNKVQQGYLEYPAHVERVRSLYREVLDWMERLARRHVGLEVIYRPHPAERLTSQLAERVDKVPNLKLIQDRPVGEWILQAGSVFVWSSTSAVEALVADKPIFALRQKGEAASAFRSGYYPILDDLPRITGFESFEEAAFSGARPSHDPAWAMAMARFLEIYDSPKEPAFVGLEKQIAGIMETGSGTAFDQVPVGKALLNFYRLQQAGKRGLHKLGLIKHFRRYEKEARERLLPDLVKAREAFLKEKLTEKPWMTGKGK